MTVTAGEVGHYYVLCSAEAWSTDENGNDYIVGVDEVEFDLFVEQYDYHDSYSKADTLEVSADGSGDVSGYAYTRLNPDNGIAIMKVTVPQNGAYNISLSGYSTQVADLVDQNGNVLTRIDTEKKVVLDAGKTYYIAYITTTRGNAVECTTSVRYIENHEHTMGNWYTVTESDALTAGVNRRNCTGENCFYTEVSAAALLPAYVTLNVKGTVPMKVKQKTTKIKVVGLQKGDRVVSWKSSNSKVVKVSSSGKLTAGKKAGKTATITVTTAAGAKASFKVKVQKAKVATKKIKVAAKKPKLAKKNKFNLASVFTPITTQDKISYSSSNKKVATVSKSGVITAKKKGKATITVKAGKKTVKIKVTVK